MEQTHRHAGETRMRQRPWPSTITHSESSAAAQTIVGRASDEVGDHRVDGDPFTRDRDPGLSRCDEPRPSPQARSCSHDLEGRGHLADGRIRADRQHDRRAIARPAMSADRQVVGRLAQLAHRRLAAPRCLGESGIAQHALMESVPHRDAALERVREQGPVRVRD